MNIEKCETCINHGAIYATGNFKFSCCTANMNMPTWDVSENKCKYETNDVLQEKYRINKSWLEGIIDV